MPLPIKRVDVFSSLFLYIAPTILDYLHLAPMDHIDGISVTKLKPRIFFIETGDKVAETESNKIFIEKVIQKTIGAYRIDPNSGLLILTPNAEKTIIANKQHAVISGDWLLARYPAEMRYKAEPIARIRNKSVILTPSLMPPYMVLVNLKNRSLDGRLIFAVCKNCSCCRVNAQLKAFYGGEV